MEAIGSVAEYDPFHLGHKHQITATRAALGEDLPVVCAMSGNWTQRGSAAIVDKWTRARLALAGGADLVLELPTPWATASAETFARGAVELLTLAGATILSFGSEAGKLTDLEAVAACLDSEAYRRELRKGLDKGLGFAVARHRAAGVLLGESAQVLENPNNNLGIEYLRAIHYLGAKVQPFTVPRRGAGHDSPDTGEGFASASAIRAMLRAGEKRAWDYLPQGSQETLGRDFAALDRAFPAILAKLRTMTAKELATLPDCSDGLEYRLLEAAGKAVDLTGLYDLAKSKRYAHARVRRVVLRAFLGMEHIPAHIPYLRVLGMTDRGRNLLRGEKAVPVVTKPTHGKGLPLMEAEARYTDLYALCFDPVRPSGLEWITSPVILHRS